MNEKKLLPPPSPYQLAIREAFCKTNDNLLVQACAGSGKTTLLAQLCETLDFMTSAVALSFNKVIAESFKQKLPYFVKSCTMHSLGYEICRKNIDKTKMDPNKRDNVLKKLIKSAGFNKSDAPLIASDADWLIGMALATMTDLNDTAAVMRMASAYNGELNMPDLSASIAAEALVQCRKDRQTIGFDDMIDAPLFHGYQPLKFSVVMVDESQDLTLQQMEFLKMILAPEGRIVAVGDRWQSIYQWRGADSSAMDLIKKTFNCVEMPLSICYRCPVAVVDMARQITTTIEVSASAIKGEVDVRRQNQYDDLIPTLEPGTMVVCRLNAPLMPMAMALIRRGTKVIIRGKDIGGGLVSMVNKLDTVIREKNPNLLTVPRELFLESLLTEAQRKVKKAIDADKMSSALFAIDQYETIVAAFAEVTSVPELVDVLKRIFSDDVTGVVLSSVHRAKGLEAPTVVILGPELMPHPCAQFASNRDEAMQQENNLKYVAITRSMQKLILQPLKGRVTASADALLEFLQRKAGPTRSAVDDFAPRGEMAADAVARGMDEDFEDAGKTQSQIDEENA